MDMITSTEFSGYCPYFERQMDIEITYRVISILGDRSPHHIKCNCYCDYMDECSYARRTGSCKVFESAPED